MGFKDHFWGHAQSYAAARPQYPDELFTFLANACAERSLAWDCGTGNGQAARSLMAYFKRVIATDASEQQIAQATPSDNIDYAVMRAEAPSLEEATLDLVVVAQALHWFDVGGFFAGVDRVLKKQGILAVWSYGLHQVDAEVDAIVHHLYQQILGDYWPPERCLVERGYEDIQFPYAAIDAPGIELEVNWSLDQLLAYLMSWSAVQRYMLALDENPLQLVTDELTRVWGAAATKKVSWPVTLYVGRK